jgi:nitronate monooxygenase/enoyl-[acyl-carrier protein] reductase II
VPNVIRTSFVDTWLERPDEAGREAERLRTEIMTALRDGRVHELVPFTGQTAGLVHDIRPAAEIVQSIIAEAREALAA